LIGATACGGGSNDGDGAGGSGGFGGSSDSDGPAASGGNAAGGNATGGNSTTGGSDGVGGTGQPGDCANGTFDHDANANTVCQSWSKCQPGQFILAEGSATEDRVCAACPGGTFSAVQDEAQCSSWLDCLPGEYVAGAPDKETDRTCEACAEGTFSSTENEDECSAFSVCAAGEFVATEGTDDADRSCSSCESGTFSTADNSAECAPWTDCGHPWKDDAAGTASSDATCQGGMRTFSSLSAEQTVDVVVDAAGDVYVVGRTSGDLAATNAGDSDAFVRKYDAAGNVDWTRQFGTNRADRANAITIDPAGNIVVAGDTRGAFEGTNPDPTDWDVFVRWLDPAGATLDTRQVSTEFWDYATDVVVDEAGDVIAAGFRTAFDGTFGLSALSYSFAAVGGGLRQGAFLPTQAGYAATVDPSGNFYFAGATSDVDLEGTGAGSDDAFVAKYDELGASVWIRQFGTDVADLAYAVVADDAGNVFVAGQTAGELEVGAVGTAFVRKYDAAGDELWTRQFGTPEGERALTLTLDADGNVLVGGYTSGDLGGDGAGGVDAFVQAFDDAGVPLWAEQFGTAEDEQVQAIGLSEDGDVFAAGSIGIGFGVDRDVFVGVIRAP
jgi:hypothetical protein